MLSYRNLVALFLGIRKTPKILYIFIDQDICTVIFLLKTFFCLGNRLLPIKISQSEKLFQI